MASQAPTVIVSEEFKTETDTVIRTFLLNENATFYEFPNALTNTERNWIHNYARNVGLVSKSIGKSTSRRITIKKPEMKTTKETVELAVTIQSFDSMTDFLNRYPIIQDPIERLHLNIYTKKTDFSDINMGQLTLGSPQLPKLSVDNGWIRFRMTLPIWSLRKTIIEKILFNQVVIITGDAGAGKTTQVPQFILDYSRCAQANCRIISAQTHRISALAAAKRVSNERGERIGQTVGFHIKLESCVGPKTSLIYCTNRVLLRTLMNGDICLKSFTHVIIDEIHERDRFSDLLMICLRECLVNYPNLRLIIMSAPMDIQSLGEYFSNPEVINVPVRLYPVRELFLDDILKVLEYESPAMSNLRAKQKNEQFGLDVDRLKEIEDCIMKCVESGTQDSFTLLLKMISSGRMPVDFQHSLHGLTGLMAAAMHGKLEVVHGLLDLGADVKLSSKESNTAYDWACKKHHTNVAALLKNFTNYLKYHDKKYAANEEEFEQILKLYQNSVSDSVDFDLLIAILTSFHLNDDLFSILVFLPDYDDIVTLKNRLSDSGRLKFKPYEIYVMHSLMQISEQQIVFFKSEKRKIILSTSISQNSFTIADVAYVIDSGKVKEEFYDAENDVSTIKNSWISKSCAQQRTMRAGHTESGWCVHLMTKSRYQTLQEHPTPEILRMPLHELCLQTKLLAPAEIRIGHFLERAIDPPSALTVANAIRHLQDIEALDANEKLTLLGQHLVDLPVQPHLAKMLIYSTIFKCLDAILTICAFLSYRNPFVLPDIPELKKLADDIRKQFSLNTFSDHLALIRIFQDWQLSQVTHESMGFCNKYFISPATMEMTLAIRTQLLAQLRASGFVKNRAPLDVRGLNQNGSNWPIVKAVLTTGFPGNIAYINKHLMKMVTKKKKKVVLNSLSSLRGKETTNNYGQSLMKIPTNWMFYEKLSTVGNNFNIVTATVVSALTVALFAHEAQENTTSSSSSSSDSNESTPGTFSPNNWLIFKGHPNSINTIIGMRQKLNHFISKRIANPMKLPTLHDEALLQQLSNILLREDNKEGLYQPTGIGHRPRIMTHNDYPDNLPAEIPSFIYKKLDMTPAEILHFDPVNVYQYHRYNPPNLYNPKEGERGVDNFSYLTQLEPQTIGSEILQNMTKSIQTRPIANMRQKAFLNFDFEHNAVTMGLQDNLNQSLVVSPSLGYQQMPHFHFDRNVHRFIVIKAANIKAIDMSISKKSWVFSPQTEKILSRLLMAGKNVMLVFSVTNSRCFQGLARLHVVRSSEFSHYSIHLPLEWFSRADITFDQFPELRVYDVLDGQELNFNIGVKLFYMFTHYTPPPLVKDFPPAPIRGRAITKTSN